jgi:hypothetical protein
VKTRFRIFSDLIVGKDGGKSYVMTGQLGKEGVPKGGMARRLVGSRRAGTYEKGLER